VQTVRAFSIYKYTHNSFVVKVLNVRLHRVTLIGSSLSKLIILIP